MKDERKPRSSTLKKGRPQKDPDQAIIDEVIDWVSSGKTLRSFCRKRGKPHYCVIYKWLGRDDTFRQRFTDARLIGADVIADECLDIADTPIKSKVVRNKTEGNKEIIEIIIADDPKARSLRVETRLKLLAKWFPQKYGDKIGVEHSGKIEMDRAIIEARKRLKKQDPEEE